MAVHPKAIRPSHARLLQRLLADVSISTVKRHVAAVLPAVTLCTAMPVRQASPDNAICRATSQSVKASMLTILLFYIISEHACGDGLQMHGTVQAVGIDSKYDNHMVM